jgi:uncharacterized membrane protein YphA (DoxX/SURF4 family)
MPFFTSGLLRKMHRVKIYSPQRLISFWDGYWFPETTAVRLSICRILVVAAQLLLFFPPLEDQINLLEKSTGFIEPQILIVAISAVVPDNVFFTPSIFTVIHWVTIAAGITTLIGLCTRTSAFVFALGNWFFLAHGSSYGEEHHSEAIFAIFLMLLAFSPSGYRFSVDAVIRRWRAGKNRSETNSQRFVTAIWPLRLVQVLLALAYFSTGLAKLVYGGLQWMNGYTLQNMIFGDAILWGRTAGIWLAQQHTLCVLLSVGTILFEVFFFLTLFIPRIIPYFIIAGTLFHTFIFITMAAPFFQHIILYSVFLEFDKWKFPFRKAPSLALGSENAALRSRISVG